ncbi:hypothetical protein PTKIN_Ptkin04bG0122700 [Pterospermum kingtungense]
MSYQPLSQLAIGEPPGDIQVCVLRKWFGINVKKNQMLTFDLLLIDEQGTALQASMNKTESDSFDYNIKEGCIYIISKFKVTKRKLTFNAISAPYMITISRDTLFAETEMNDHIFLAHYFEFAKFEDPQPRSKNNHILTDVIGLIVSISRISKIYVSNNPEQVPRRIVHLKNLRGQTITATLWGDFALSIDDQLMSQQTNQILILAGVIVNEFRGENSLSTCSASKVYIDLELPIVAEMKVRFEEQPQKVELFELQQKPQLSPVEGENVNRVNIKQLLESNHKTAQVKKYIAFLFLSTLFLNYSY